MKTELPQAKGRSSKNQIMLDAQQRRKQKIINGIKRHVFHQRYEVLYADTVDLLIGELVFAGVTGSSLRGATMRHINGAFREVQTILLEGVPGLTLHIEYGNAMLGVKEDYWPTTPFSLYSDDGLSAIPDAMLRKCTLGQKKQFIQDY